MSATGNSPTIGLNLRVLPLYEQSLSRCITCQNVCVQQLHAAKRLPPYLGVHLRRFVTMLLLRNKGQ